MTTCELHPAYEADYCPVCGTTVPIGDRVPMREETRRVTCQGCHRTSDQSVLVPSGYLAGQPALAECGHCGHVAEVVR